MSFTQGLSGLNAASKGLEVIGNNVANAATVGFKGSQAQFSDVFAAALTGAGTSQIGIGVKLATVAQQFTQGNVTITNNSLDMAVNGPGFFRMENNGVIGYSRNGQFQLDKDGFIVSAQGHKLTGYPADAAGNIIAAAPQALNVPTADLAPRQSTSIVFGLNLDSRDIAPIIPFNPADPNTFSNSTSATTYDSLGNSQVTTVYFRKAAANTWDVYSTVSDPTTGTYLYSNSVPAVVPPAVPAAGTWASNGQLTFNANGTFLASTVVSPGFTPPGALAETLAMDFSVTTQFGSLFGVTKLSQDGYTSGRLSGFSTGADGIITGRYSNGQTKSLGQVALATFSNPQGLQPLGGNEWAETGASGLPLVGAPGTGILGVLQTSAVEDSNVDLTAELVNMITAQRVYQANAQTIKTQDSVMQTLVNLR